MLKKNKTWSASNKSGDRVCTRPLNEKPKPGSSEWPASRRKVVFTSERLLGKETEMSREAREVLRAITAPVSS